MQSNFVQAGEARLHYFEQGTGPETVVLVHGYASSAVLWRYTMDHLDGSKHRVIAFNNRGAGESDRPETEDAYTVESFADDLFNAVEALGLDQFTLVGHSMGGATVTQFTMAHQDRLQALVLLNSAPLKGRPLAADWEATIRATFGGADRPLGDMGFQAEHVSEEFKDAVVSGIARNPIERFIGGRRSMSALRLRERLGEIGVPTLVIGGDRDTTVGVDNILADYLALREDRRSLHMFHGIGHSPNVEVPERLAGLLGRFVTEVNAASGQPSPVSG